MVVLGASITPKKVLGADVVRYFLFLISLILFLGTSPILLLAEAGSQDGTPPSACWMKPLDFSQWPEFESRMIDDLHFVACPTQIQVGQPFRVALAHRRGVGKKLGPLNSSAVKLDSKLIEKGATSGGTMGGYSFHLYNLKPKSPGKLSLSPEMFNLGIKDMSFDPIVIEVKDGDWTAQLFETISSSDAMAKADALASLQTWGLPREWNKETRTKFLKAAIQSGAKVLEEALSLVERVFWRERDSVDSRQLVPGAMNALVSGSLEAKRKAAVVLVKSDGDLSKNIPALREAKERAGSDTSLSKNLKALLDRAERQEEVISNQASIDPIKLLAWFNSLGVRGGKGLKLVRVTSIRSVTSDPGSGERIENKGSEYAFLLSDSEDSFEVKSLALTDRKYDKSDKFNSWGWNKATYEKLSMCRDGKKIAEELSRSTETGSRQVLGAVTRLGAGFQTLVLADAAFEAGCENVSTELIKAIYSFSSGAPNEDEIISQISKDYSFEEFWRTVIDIGNPEIERSALLERFERVERLFPSTDAAAKAKPYIEVLESMAREDRAFEKRKDVGEIESLIYHLRDQNGMQVSQPGSPDIFYTPEFRQDTPAHILVKKGFEAVPALIKALDDRSLTRTVGYWRNFTFSHYVITVGSAARRILERIAGRSFACEAAKPDKSGFREDKIHTCPKEEVWAEIEKWWAEASKIDEKTYLTKLVERGDSNSWEGAKLLAQRYGENAVPSILKAISSTNETGLKRNLLLLAGETSKAGTSKELERLLEKELNDNTSLSTRALAARMLYEHGNRKGLEGMIKEWKKYLEGQRASGTGSFFPDDNSPGHIIQLLADSGDEKAFLALTEKFSSRSLPVRLAIVSAFAPPGLRISGDSVRELFPLFGLRNRSKLVATSFGITQSPEESEGKAKPTIQSNLKRFLKSCLNDIERSDAVKGTVSEGLGKTFKIKRTFKDPSVAEIASYILEVIPG